MSVKQVQRGWAALLIIRSLALCRRVRNSIVRHVQIVLQRAVSRKLLLDPERLRVSGANLRPKVTAMPKGPVPREPMPFVVRGHAKFGKALRRDSAAATKPRLPSELQPETAPGDTHGAPNAQNKR